jgi:hypothetical protein
MTKNEKLTDTNVQTKYIQLTEEFIKIGSEDCGLIWLSGVRWLLDKAYTLREQEKVKEALEEAIEALKAQGKI